MKDCKHLFLKKTRCPAQEFDDRENYVYPTEKIDIEYSHIFINKKRRLIDAVKKYAKKLAVEPYAIIITDDFDYNGPKIIGGWTININGKTYTSC